MQQVSSRLPEHLMQTQWAQQINKLLSIPLLQGTAIVNVALAASTPLAIKTTIGRIQQGWFLTDNSADCSVWRTQPFNSTTLTLESSADTIVSLWVY